MELLKKLSYLEEPQVKRIVDSEKLKPIKIAALVSFVIMVVAQVLLVIFFDGEQTSDSLVYIERARDLAEKGTWYPSVYNIYSSSYLNANGLINLLVLVFRFTDNLGVVYAINIMLVQLMLWSYVYIIKKSPGNVTAHYWFIILFCLLNTFWSEVVFARTEIPFTALAAFAMALLYSGKKYNYIFAGIVFALANWIRPLGLPLLVAAVLVFLYKHISFKHILMTLSSFAVVIAMIGTFAYMNCGFFAYQASTLGYNLLMSANDDADGSYMDVYSEEGQVGYIPPEIKENMTFKDLDSYYTKKSVQWIKENPVKYIMQTPKKLFYLFSTETYSGSSYFDNKIETGGIDYIRSLYSKFTGQSDEGLKLGDILICFDQLWYMVVFVLFVCGFFSLFKKGCWRFMLPHLAFVVLATGITVVVVGGARYHFPFLPIFMMYGALFLQRKTTAVSEDKI